jgi:uncharacterized membrane protein
LVNFAILMVTTIILCEINIMWVILMKEIDSYLEKGPKVEKIMLLHVIIKFLQGKFFEKMINCLKWG